MSRSFFEEIKRIRAIADTGLLYAGNDYEKERHQELIEIADRLFANLSGEPLDLIQKAFTTARDYPTAKVDVRAFVLEDERILMVRESADGKWSLPGGWADIGFSPAETAVKEVKEETGLDVTAETLLAVFDKKMHPHPPQPYYVYKIVIQCEVTGGTLLKGFDLLDVDFFSISNLPELSEERILKSQIELLYQRIKNKERGAYFD